MSLHSVSRRRLLGWLGLFPFVGISSQRTPAKPVLLPLAEALAPFAKFKPKLASVSVGHPTQVVTFNFVYFFKMEPYDGRLGWHFGGAVQQLNITLEYPLSQLHEIGYPHWDRMNEQLGYTVFPAGSQDKLTTCIKS